MSAAVAVSIQEPPTVIASPGSVTLCAGLPLHLEVTFAGTPPLQVQWFLDGAPISGATGAEIDLPAVGASDAGTYTAEVSNVCGVALSDPAVVIVRAAPSIVDGPVPSTVCEGDPVSLAVIALGSFPLFYQWYRDGAPISGAEGATFAIPAAIAADEGSYSVQVSNSCGSATSIAAAVTVRTPPSIGVQPTGAQVCPGDPFTLTVDYSGAEPVSVQWFQNGSAITGATGATYSVASAGSADAGAYSASVTNDCGSAVSATALVELLEPPQVSLPPDLSACVGDDVVLAATATGTPPLDFQWSRNGVPIPGADQPSLPLGVVDPTYAGAYQIEVGNACSTASASMILAVGTSPEIVDTPDSVRACEGETVIFIVVARGAPPLAYQWFRDGALLPGEEQSTLVFDPVEAAAAGDYTVEISNPCGIIATPPATLTVATTPSGCDCNGNGILDLDDIAQGTSQDGDGDGVPDECQIYFIRGDSNEDGVTTIADAIDSLLYLFEGGVQNCLVNLDANDDGAVDLADPVMFLIWLFAGGVPPPPPFPACGADPTPDLLPCDDPQGCP